jgi:hypothetical protein
VGDGAIGGGGGGALAVGDGAIGGGGAALARGGVYGGRVPAEVDEELDVGADGADVAGRVGLGPRIAPAVSIVLGCDPRGGSASAAPQCTQKRVPAWFSLPQIAHVIDNSFGSTAEKPAVKHLRPQDSFVVRNPACRNFPDKIHLRRADQVHNDRREKVRSDHHRSLPHGRTSKRIKRE